MQCTLTRINAIYYSIEIVAGDLSWLFLGIAQTLQILHLVELMLSRLDLQFFHCIY